MWSPPSSGLSRLLLHHVDGIVLKGRDILYCEPINSSGWQREHPPLYRAGIACIVPPDGWEPPFALERGTNGQSAESFKFMIRKQLTSHLCMRVANTGKATRRAPSR